MANKLRNKKARVSFFSFQDMITTVTGVLVVVMIMLSLDVTRQAASAEAVTHNGLRQEVEEARRQLESKLAALEQLQMKLGKRESRVFVIPQPDLSGKEVVLVVLSATRGWVARQRQSSATEFEDGADVSSFKHLLDTCDARHDRLVFYVRPSGITHFKSCRVEAGRRGFSYGYDAAEEDQQYLLARP